MAAETHRSADRRLAERTQLPSGSLDELKKTTWPTRQEALRLTYVVIGVIIVLGSIWACSTALLSTLVNKFSLHQIELSVRLTRTIASVYLGLRLRDAIARTAAETVLFWIVRDGESGGEKNATTLVCGSYLFGPRKQGDDQHSAARRIDEPAG